MNRACVLLLSLTLTLTTLAIPALGADDEGWVSLFNGKDMTGWRINEDSKAFRVEDGTIIVQGPRAHAFYVGEDGKANFRNFVLKAEVMTFPKANSGIYIHTRYQDKDWPKRGYEAQVNNSHSDPKRTGGLYSVQDNFDAVAKDNEWFTYEIMVQGKHIVIKINDKVVSDYTEPEDLNRPERQLSEGTFALQAHDPGSKVCFRNLQVKVLPE